ncbi:hypothetical protein F2Q69_00058055, partial [Brassica cretica]
KGLRVTIECKVNKGHFVTKGSGNIDEEGKFGLKISPHHDIVSDDGALKEECYAQLHSAAGTLCPAHNGLESTKSVFLYKSGDKHVLGLKQNMKFSPELCVSKFFWPMPKFPPSPPFELPPFPKFKKPCPPPVPVHEPPPKKPPKMHPPPVPVYKPPPKVEHPPSVPVHKPPPIPKKPCPTKPPKKVDPSPVPVHKPPPKIVLPPPVPIYKPPKKPCPPKPPKIELPPPVPIYKTTSRRQR